MPYPAPQSAVFRKKGVLNLYRKERARVNTTAVDGLSSLNVCIGRVNLFTSNPGGKWWQILCNVRYILYVERLQSMETKSEKNTRIIKSCKYRNKSESTESLIAKALQVAIRLNESDLESPRNLSPEGYRSCHRELVSYLQLLNATHLQ